MKINNVNKQESLSDGGAKILLAAITFLLLVALFAFYGMNSVITTTAPVNTRSGALSETTMQTSGMSEIDKIKQKIREAESLKDSYEVAREHATQSRDFEKSGEMAKKVAEQEATIKKLYEDLHEANIKEGDNGETK